MLLLQIREGLYIEKGGDVREEEVVQPNGFVEAERLKCGLVEDEDWAGAH